MYDFAGKAFDTMTVAELNAFLAQPEIAPHVTSKHNTKTRKAELVLIASAAHRSFHDSGDADKARAKAFATDGQSVAEYIKDMPAEPAQGLNEDRSQGAANRAHVLIIETRPLTYTERLENYERANDGRALTPRQLKRLAKKSRKHAANDVRHSGGYGNKERV